LVDGLLYSFEEAVEFLHGLLVLKHLLDRLRNLIIGRPYFINFLSAKRPGLLGVSDFFEWHFKFVEEGLKHGLGLLIDLREKVVFYFFHILRKNFALFLEFSW